MTESTPAQQPALPAAYLAPSRPIDERVRDLLSRLRLDEKIGQMRHTAQAIPRLSIPAYDFLSEALHGVAVNGRATVFRQAIGVAATWDPVLIEQIASAVSEVPDAKRGGASGKCGDSRA